GAMSDLNSILAVRPGDVPALTLRGLVFTAQRDYAKALDDLNLAVEKQATVEGLAARAAVFEAQNDFDKASADLRRATELRPRNVFEAAAQSAARQKLQQLAKRIPCGSAPKGEGTCL